MMRVKQADLIRFETLQGHRAIGNPDTFVSEIHQPGLGLSGSFLGPGAREKRPVNEGELHFPGMVGNGDREETGVLVIHMDEIDAVIRFEGHQPQPFPVKQILRYRQGDPWADRRKGRVSHHIALEPFHEGNTRILATAAAVRPQFVIRFRLERNAEPFDSAGIPRLVEFDPSDADARIVPLRDEPWKKVKMTIRATNRGGVQGAFDFVRITGFGLHDQPQAPQLKSNHKKTPSRGHAHSNAI